jgi:N-acetyl-anhydromuramoyl-L-alanine amidase
MNLDKQQGLVEEAALHMSPNQDNRPDPTDISGIVIHNISLPPGEFGGGWVDDLFLNNLDPDAHPYFAEISHLRVSTHILIRRNGELIQYVPFDKRAWHAGLSSWNGRERCNDFTIGIELEGCDDNNFEQAQYQQLSELIVALCDSYPLLTTDNVKGHSDISPGRKTDPGPFFDWDYLRSLI